jgi:hypothetical protein
MDVRLMAICIAVTLLITVPTRASPSPAGAAGVKAYLCFQRQEAVLDTARAPLAQMAIKLKAACSSEVTTYQVLALRQTPQSLLRAREAIFADDLQRQAETAVKIFRRHQQR